MIAHHLDKWKGGGSCCEGVPYMQFFLTVPAAAGVGAGALSAVHKPGLDALDVLAFEIPKPSSQSSDDSMTRDQMVMHRSRRAK